MILAYDIGEQQIPASDKSQQLTNSHIAVKVSRARFGNPGSKLRVAKSGKYRRQGSDEEGNDNAGSCGVSGHLSGEHIDPCSQGAPHAQGDQVQGGKASVKSGLFPIGLDGFPARETHQKGLDHTARHASAWGSDQNSEGII